MCRMSHIFHVSHESPMCPGEEFREQGEEKDSRVRRYAGAKEPLLSYVARVRPTGNSPYQHI